MKTKKTMAFSFGIAVLSLVFIFSSCSKDSPAGTHKLQFKVSASAGSDLNIAVYGYDDNIKTISGLTGTTWQSEEITTTAGAVTAAINASAVGVDASSTLKVEIWVDGKKVKEGTGQGPALVAAASYSF